MLLMWFCMPGKMLVVRRIASADLLDGRAAIGVGVEMERPQGGEDDDLDAGVEGRSLGQVVDAVRVDRGVRTEVLQERLDAVTED